MYRHAEGHICGRVYKRVCTHVYRRVSRLVKDMCVKASVPTCVWTCVAGRPVHSKTMWAGSTSPSSKTMCAGSTSPSPCRRRHSSPKPQPRSRAIPRRGCLCLCRYPPQSRPHMTTPYVQRSLPCTTPAANEQPGTSMYADMCVAAPVKQWWSAAAYAKAVGDYLFKQREPPCQAVQGPCIKQHCVPRFCFVCTVD